MDTSRRRLLKVAGTAAAAGSLLGGGARSTRAHADVADDYRWAPESNYANGARSAADVEWLVLHTIEGSYEGGITWLQNPESNVSAHFVVGNEPGQITQMVHCEDVAWSQGHGAYNDTGISIEIEGYADETQFNDHVYRQVAEVSRWVCDRYDVPVRHPTFDLGPCDADGAGGIIGHDQVPSPHDCSRVTGGRYDPGDTWDWERYVGLVRGDQCTGDRVTERMHGSLSGAGDRSEHTHAFRTHEPCRTTVSLSGPDDADFDLFLTRDGRPPTRDDHDRSSHGASSRERVDLGEAVIDPDASLGIAVESYRGSGAYTLTVTETGTHRFAADQWVRTTADGWAYRRPWASATKLDWLSEYTHGRIVNGPTRTDGRVWWGVHLVNERLWAWIPQARLTGAPGGPRFTLGDRVHTTGYATVYRRPDEDAAAVDRKPPFAGGRVVNSADRNDGHVWWGIRFDDGSWAWCPQVDLSG